MRQATALLKPHSPEPRMEFTPEQIELLGRTVARGATADELTLLVRSCERTQLDPFSRQMYLQKRSERDPESGDWIDRLVPEVSIDGLRLCAERTGKYAGQLGPEWCGPDGKWRDIWLSKEPPAAARVGILREDFKEPIWGKALFAEYVQINNGKPNAFWTRMAANQIAKCAEALGFRKAFPRDLSGLYVREEMLSAENAQTSAEPLSSEVGKADPGAGASAIRRPIPEELKRGVDNIHDPESNKLISASLQQQLIFNLGKSGDDFYLRKVREAKEKHGERIPKSALVDLWLDLWEEIQRGIAEAQTR